MALAIVGGLVLLAIVRAGLVVDARRRPEAARAGRCAVDRVEPSLAPPSTDGSDGAADGRWRRRAGRRARRSPRAPAGRGWTR
ncbi:MAG: hypothetical protein MZW92_55930 [Comamonadaceae bacterium]|nr:hypothetical protein [Comamonadaceae bacterium]